MPSPAEPVAAPAEFGVRRVGRALVGWMTEQEGVAWLAGRQIGVEPQPDDLARVRGAIAAVGRRTRGVDQSEITRDIPAQLESHIASLKTSAPNFFGEGFEVKLIDLTKVCAVQPHVCTDSTQDRLAVVDVESIQSLAELTLPLPSPASLPVQFDPAKNAWIVASANPNLRIVGNFQTPLPNAGPGLGFAVALNKSYLQLARFQGRYILRDGYHRAVGLLGRGVTWAPAFVRDFSLFNDLTLPPGLFGQEVWLGDRPPLLGDYQNNDVACNVRIPAFQKLIVIQALEVHTLA